MSEPQALPAPHVVETDRATGAVYDHGAHVVGWTPAGADPVIWVSPATQRVEGAAIRGGIPICFPWFGPGRSGERTPAHGFARTARWRCVAREGDSLTFELAPDDLTEQERAAWPHPFRALCTVTFGQTLDVRLVVENPSDQPLDVEAALHTYLAVADIRETRVEGLEGAQYVDKVAGGTHVQVGAVTFDGETDRVYANEGPVRVVDGGRTIVVESVGASKTVVWNPGQEKAAGMADVADWDRFCCVEAANALDGCVTIAPGGSHTLAQRLTLA